jgi:hypothetical protein
MKMHAKQAIKGAIIGLLNNSLKFQRLAPRFQVTDLSDDWEIATVKDTETGSVDQTRAELLLVEHLDPSQTPQSPTNRGAIADQVARVRAKRVNWNQL